MRWIVIMSASMLAFGSHAAYAQGISGYVEGGAGFATTSEATSGALSGQIGFCWRAKRRIGAAASALGPLGLRSREPKRRSPRRKLGLVEVYNPEQVARSPPTSP